MSTLLQIRSRIIAFGKHDAVRSATRKVAGSLDTGWTQDLLAWLNAHPGWGSLLVFLVAFFESLVLVGILLPGIVILFGVGTLIGLGILEMAPVWIAATTGAFFGDSLSYALGHRFRSHLLDIWPFSRYPSLAPTTAKPSTS